MRGFPFAAALFGAMLSAGVWLTAGHVSAATKAERTRAATEQVAEALFSEIYGQDSQRSELLAAALEQVPDYVPALWHTGHVRQNNRWVKFDEVPKLATEDERLTAYRRARQEYPKTLEGRLALAEWCARKKLLDQQRAHLTEALEINPEHPQARHLSGYRKVNGVWLSADELSRAAARAQQVAAALAECTPRLKEIRKALDSRSQQQRAKAAERLHQITDPSAVPAIELVFCADDQQAALLGVETLDQITGYEASVALARQAVFSPWQPVRDAAVEKLKARDVQDYVPPLLSALQSPVQSRAALYQEPSGRLAYRHILYREGQDQRQLAVFDTRYYRGLGPASANGIEAVKYCPTGETFRLGRAPRPDEKGPTVVVDGGPQEYRANAARDAAAQAQAIHIAVARHNAMVQMLDQEIFRVLSAATGAVVAQTAESWWQWWNDYNELYVPEYKPLRTVYRRDGKDVQSAHLGKIVKYSCLAAGTPIWTESGPMPIEQIKVGDRVLSQNVQTGELAYKPVLRTTFRPPAALLELQTHGETIACTGGHPFWVCGEGWVMGRNLAPGTRFHRPTGTTPVDTVAPGGNGPAYNLVVADFHTYFVGGAKILSHDNTIRRPTDAIVPGLASR
jgi:hypothetical protein